jgi:hypothetical protein
VLSKPIAVSYTEKAMKRINRSRPSPWRQCKDPGTSGQPEVNHRARAIQLIEKTMAPLFELRGIMQEHPNSCRC